MTYTAGLLVGEQGAHVVPVAQVRHLGVRRKARHPSGMQQHVPQCDLALAARDPNSGHTAAILMS
jgi:hypothetical protein